MVPLQFFMSNLLQSLEEQDEEKLQRVASSPGMNLNATQSKPMKSILKTKSSSDMRLIVSRARMHVKIIDDNARSSPKLVRIQPLQQRNHQATTPTTSVITTTSSTGPLRSNRWNPMFVRQESDSCLNVPKRCSTMNFARQESDSCLTAPQRNASTDLDQLQFQLPAWPARSPQSQQRARSVSDSGLVLPTRKESPHLRGSDHGLAQKILVQRLEELPLIRPTPPPPPSSSPRASSPGHTPTALLKKRYQRGNRKSRKESTPTLDSSSSTTTQAELSLQSYCDAAGVITKDDDRTRMLSRMIHEKRKLQGQRADWAFQKFQQQQVNQVQHRQMIQSTLQWILDGAIDETTRVALSSSAVDPKEDPTRTSPAGGTEKDLRRALPTPTPFMIPL
jgi:hypothetical protein